MELVIGFLVLVVVMVVPIMIGARVVDARNTGFGHALVAVIILSIISSGVNALTASVFVSFVISSALGAMVLAGVLGTTFLRGLAISLIAAVIQVVVAIVLAMVILGGVPAA